MSIDGRMDNTGNAVNNLDLSKRRAASVKNYLLSKGIDATRLSSKGYGESKPVASNDTKDGRALNGRVELLLTF